MGRTKYNKIYSNPCLNEVVYSVLRSAAPEDLLKLRGRFLKAAKSEKGAKFFAANSRLEEKIALLSEFGIRYFGIFANRGNVTHTKLKGILDKFYADQKGAALSDLSQLEMYVEDDKEYIHLLGLMANLSNHPSYALNLEFERNGYHAKQWTTSRFNKNDNNVVKAMEHADYLTNMLLQGSLMIERSTILFTLTPNQLRILIYLYSKRHTHVSKDRIHMYFLGNMTKQVATTAIMKLLKLFYVEEHIKKEPEFTITSLGIGVVNRFLQTTFNQLQ